MTDRTVGVDVSGGQIQGIVGAGSVVIENLTFYSRAPEEPVQAADAEPVGPSPYPGLAYFGPADADLFFGRDAAIARLAAAVDRQSFTALVGASGSGKSSVVLAGLAPRLNAAGNWRFSHFRIGTELEANPFLALARALAPLYVASDSDVERLRNSKLLATSLAAGELTLRDVFADCRSRNKGRRILLIADQFEEAFTLAADEAVRARFIDVLLAGFRDPAAGGVPDICLILTMRADFYGRALHHRPLADALQNHVENLGPMNRAELRAAIVCPAENAAVTFEAGLVETLLDAVESKPGGLPLLQFALREMWARQERKRITRKSYDEIGGVEGALAKRAETVFAALTRSGADSEMEKSFQRLFTRLVTLGEGQEDTRRVVERTELGDELWYLAQRLAGEENRLVVTNASSAHETAEVVHEALIRHWPRLVDWINRDRVFQSWLRRIRSNIELWSAHPDDEGPLLRGGMLAQATEWLARRRDDLSGSELAYIEASVALGRRLETEKEAARQAEIVRQQELAEAARRLAEEQRQRARTARRYTLAAGAAATIAFAAAALAITFAWVANSASERANAERDRAQQATVRAEEQHQLAVARQLATEARVALAEERSAAAAQRSLFLATASLGSAWTQEGFEAWAEAIKLSPPRPKVILGSDQGPYRHVTVSPDGSLVAAAGKSSIFLLDGRSLELVATLDQEGARTLAFSPPRGELLAAGVGRRVLIWNVAERKMIKAIPEEGERFDVRSIAFDSTAKRLAFAGMDYYARIFETTGWSESGKEWSRAAREKHQSTLSVAFSPDGRWLLSNGSRLLAWDVGTATDPASGAVGAAPSVRSVVLDEYGAPPYFLAFSHDGRLLAANGSVWPVTSAEDGGELRLADKTSFGVPIVAVSRDMSAVATLGPAVWQTSGSTLREIARMAVESSVDTSRSVVFEPSGKGLLAAGDRLERWDVTSRAEFAQLPHDTEVLAIGASADSAYIATTTSDGFLHVWNTSNWTKARALEIRKREGEWTGSNVAFSSDGRWLAATSENVWKVFATHGWREVVRGEHKSNLAGVSFSPDGRWAIAFPEADSIEVAALDSGRTMSLADVAEPAKLPALSLSPDGRWLAAKKDPTCFRSRASAPRFAPGVVRVWQLATGERVASMPLGVEALPEGCSGHDPSADDTPEPPSGKVELAKDASTWPTIAGPAADSPEKNTSSDRRWSASNKQDAIDLLHENGRTVTLPQSAKVNDLGFLPNGRWLVTTSSDGTARVWALTPEDMIATSCARLQRNLSEADWHKHVGNEPYAQICPGLPSAAN